MERERDAFGEGFDFDRLPAALRFMANPRNAEAAAELAAQLRRWWIESRDPLECSLGMPESPESWRRLRDLELCRAADHVTPDEGVRRGVPGSEIDRRVSALRREVLAFLALRWPAWRGHVGEPGYCRPMDLHLLRAARCRCETGGAGEVLPTSRAALKRIIGPAIVRPEVQRAIVPGKIDSTARRGRAYPPASAFTRKDLP